MQKTVKFLKHYPKRDWNTDSFVCGFEFSVTDSHLIGTAYEVETFHRLKVILSDRLMINWGLWDTDENRTSDEMLKVAYQSAEEHISTSIKSETSLEDELPALERMTTNSPKSCPYKIGNIAYPSKDIFVVDFEKASVPSFLPSPFDKDKEGFTPKSESKSLRVFLCHARVDVAAVRDLYLYLRKEGVDVWLDKEKLLPGTDWELEIRRAVETSDIVVVCLSRQFHQAGYRQKEVKLALDTAMKQPEGEIFIIPARLEVCDVPDSLRKWQWVDLFETDGSEKLISALRSRAERVGAALRSSEKEILLGHFIELGNRLRIVMLSLASRHGLSSARTTDFPNVLVFLRDTGSMEPEEFFEIDELDKLHYAIVHGEVDFKQELTPRIVNRLEKIVFLYEDLESEG